ncbi:predicted protein [Nematostella vectensis]|uniref:Integrase core domain-containing protein n=1 Tax=Nematostella vectensis TaxID=45351 RepID=A7SZD7_NEMVE|nr:predicted protein [Nematostella vectensis]|eukprot:XP_001623027.1 predicted protein [Nematostella vectensis]
MANVFLLFLLFSFDRLLVMLLLVSMDKPTYCVLPSFTPASGDDDSSTEDCKYFSQDYTNKEIASFLVLRHGLVISVRTVKRTLKLLYLRRARSGNESPMEAIVYAVVQMLENSCGSFLEYRQLTKWLRRKFQLIVTRDTIMKCIRIIDPEGVERRRRRRLKRRKYVTPGPNFLWHIDGWDKLAPFGFFIHGAIDGYSRRILWLEVASTNKNPSSRFFLPGCSGKTWWRGTENTVISALQQFFGWQDNDEFSSAKSFIQGKSSSNQRIEAWWSKLRDGGGGWWINLFKDMRDSGIYNDDDCLANECLKFCFLPILRKELHLVAELWNTHTIASQKRHEVIGGKPNVLFFMPELYNTENYLRYVDLEDVQAHVYRIL